MYRKRSLFLHLNVTCSATALAAETIDIVGRRNYPYRLSALPTKFGMNLFIAVDVSKNSCFSKRKYSKWFNIVKLIGSRTSRALLS